MNKPIKFRQLLAKIDCVLLIKTLYKNLANISLLLSKMAKKIDEKVIFLVKAIELAIDTFIFKIKFCTRYILRFDKNYKNA